MSSHINYIYVLLLHPLLLRLNFAFKVLTLQSFMVFLINIYIFAFFVILVYHNLLYQIYAAAQALYKPTIILKTKD
jgi:hypothetical protein